jgi:hypothetical protein
MSAQPSPLVTIVAVAISVLLSLSLVGCAVDAPAPSSAADPSQPILPTPTDSSPGPTETPEPTITAEPYAGPATCSNLLDKSSLRKLAKHGYADIGDAFTEKVAGEPALGQLFQFLQSSGIVCKQSRGSSDGIIYAWGPISEADAELQRAEMLRNEVTFRGTQVEQGYEIWSADGDVNGPFAASYAFGDGYWALSYGEKAAERLEEVVDNAPAF